MRHPTILLACVLALAPACAKAPKKQETPTRPATAEMPIENFAKVAEGVYRGAQPDAAGFRALKALGVKTIVNLRSKHDDGPEAKPLGLGVVQIPMSAKLSLAPPTDAEIKTFLDTVLDPARRPVYVHCAKGKDRTGTMCAVYRMEVDGWAPAKAHAEMLEFGWHDEMYPEVGKFVLAYEPRLAAAPAAK